MKAFLKTSFFSIVPHPRLPADRASILKYHCISDSPSHLCVSQHRFAMQMQYLADMKIPVISLAQLVSRLKRREGCGGAVVITFDDGYRDSYSAALPILESHRFPATLFMITNLIGAKDNGHTYLSATELQEMAGSGIFEIGTHTKSHARLDVLNAADARTEVAGSKKVLEDLLGRTVRFMSYPWGDYSHETLGIVEACGLEAAVSVHEGTVSAATHPYILPRNSVDRSTSFTQFRGNVSTAVDTYSAVKGRVMELCAPVLGAAGSFCLPLLDALDAV